MKFPNCRHASIVIRVVIVLCLLYTLETVDGIINDANPFGSQAASANNGLCDGDFDRDEDVDGENLFSQAADDTWITLANFAADFGRTDCPKIIDSSAFTTIMTALAEGQFTLNKRWTQIDLDAMNITDPVEWKGNGTVDPEKINSYTTLVQQYKQRLKQCEQDALKPLDSGDNRGCYPKLVIDRKPPLNDQDGCADVGNLLDFRRMRYGYYCGLDYPQFGAFAEGAPEPLDAVDYCCRIHDTSAWGEGGEKECGIVMCLNQATGFPSNIMAILPRVEESRQCWYDWAASFGWGDNTGLRGCGGNQPNDARRPILGP